MVAAGYWLIPAFPALRIPLLHVVYIGGFSLMIFCVSTMVCLNHSGHGPMLHRPLALFYGMGLGVFLSMILRFLANLSSSNFFLLLGISSGLWMAVGIAWLFFSTPYLYE
jgi:uncharacterized protein involved in response to NO